MCTSQQLQQCTTIISVGDIQGQLLRRITCLSAHLPPEPCSRSQAWDQEGQDQRQGSHCLGRSERRKWVICRHVERENWTKEDHSPNYCSELPCGSKAWQGAMLKCKIWDQSKITAIHEALLIKDRQMPILPPGLDEDNNVIRNGICLSFISEALWIAVILD